MCACCVVGGYRCDQALIASDEQRKKARKKKDNSQAEMMSQPTAPVKSRQEVDKAAREVHAFLMNDQSPLRAYMSALCDGGIYFVSNVHVKSASAACSFRKETEDSVAGISPTEFVIAIQGRLCE